MHIAKFRSCSPIRGESMHPSRRWSSAGNLADMLERQAPSDRPWEELALSVRFDLTTAEKYDI